MLKQKHKQKLLKTQLLGWFFLFFILLPFSTKAWTFDPNNIFTDAELRDKNSLSKAAIQVFLEREGSVLKNLQAEAEGKNKPASEIIWEVGQKYNISPKFLLAKVEKEKGLIQKSTASEKDIDWAAGYSCFNNKCNDKYKGFFNQVESAAITQNIYYEKSSTFPYRAGETGKTKDGYDILPKNQATANLYIYTPYIGYAPDLGYTNIEKTAGRFGANYLFWQIWTRYFSEKKIPNGFFIKNADSFWAIENGKKRKFETKEIFLQDHKESDAILVSQKTLDAYEDGAPIYFANNTLVRSNLNNQSYLLINGMRRPITDNSALALLSDVRIAIESVNEIPVVQNEKIENYAVGNPIDANTKYPQGKIFEDETGQLYLVQDGMKNAFDKAVWAINFNSAPPSVTTSDFLSGFITGSPVKLKDGAIVKNTQGSIYLISDNERLKIKNPDIFPKIIGETKFNEAITVSDATLNLHKDGLNISYIDDTLSDPVPVAPPPTPISSETLNARLSVVIPESILVYVNQKTSVQLKIQNTGTKTWTHDTVWLTSSTKNAPLNFDEPEVLSGNTGTFTLELDGFQEPGMEPVHFKVFGQNNGEKIELLSFGKFVLVRSGDTAEIVSHNIPIAVKNSWKPVTIKMKIKNTSDSLMWLSKKSALEITDQNNNPSPFYDQNDWVRKDVAAVPLNKSSIKPGETGEFAFTLKVKNLKSGVYQVKMKLHLLDKEKVVFLNNEESWTRLLRVDK